MHPDPTFGWRDQQALRAFVGAQRFGMLFAQTPDGPAVAHIPVVWLDDRRIGFHLSRGNRLAKHVDGARALFVVNGPHAYVSPDWYGLADQVPTGFEAEFVNARGRMTLYRGILLPYSSDGLMIDFIHGVLSWKELADPLLQASLDSELIDSAAVATQVPPPGSAAALWNQPDFESDAAPEAIAHIAWPTHARPGTPIVLVGRVAEDGSVAITGSVVGDARLADRVLRTSQ